MKIKFLIFIITIATSLSFINAQERKNDTIDDQVVNVVKPYTPTISDAFKIKDTPKLSDSNMVKKKEVKYNIFSIPVASTFTPAKGKAANVDKAKPVKLYDNYASLGVGTYTTILGEVYLNHELSSTENVGGYFSHHSSQGGIDNVFLDDNFSKTGLNAHYSQKLRDFSWKVDGGVDLMTYNWYGLPEGYEDQASDIDPRHSFNSFHIGGKLKFDDAIIKDGSVRFRRFGDDHDSGENRFVAKTNFAIPVQGEEINTEFYVDYIGGSFDESYFGGDEINYGNVTFGLSPSYQMNQDDLTVNLGVRLVYLNDTEFSDNKFFIYPNFEASYRLVDEILIAYGGIKGELQQNSYYQFASENPFVSPTLLIAPTDQRYNGFIGLKGKLSNNVSYNIKGSYYSEDNKPLYRLNTVRNFSFGSGAEDYYYGNSFGIVYDDVTTFSVGGELNIDVNRNFTLGLKGEYFGYNTDTQAEAWNLPDVTGSIFMDVQITEQWFAGASAYFVGERKDLFELEGSLTGDPIMEVITLESYFDANAHLGYKINDQLSIFAKVNNILNQDYQRYLNFPVQGFQALAGATYQFDF